MAQKVFLLTEGDAKRMPIHLTQDGALLSWTPSSVKLRLSRGGVHVGEITALPGATPDEWYYDWSAADYSTYPGGYVYEARLVVTKPVGVLPVGPETVPSRGGLQIDIAKAL